MGIEPKAGLVVRYEFLWKEEAERGQDEGKDRPCAITLAAKQDKDGSHKVLLCPITHSPPTSKTGAIAIPAKVSQHLGLDDDQSWLKTDQVNQLTWPKDHMPFGILPVAKGQWIYGEMPQAIGRAAFDQVRDNARAKKLSRVDRDIKPTSLWMKSSGRER